MKIELSKASLIKVMSFVAILSTTFPSFGQESLTKKGNEFNNIIHVNMLPFIYFSANIFYEHSLKNNISLGVGYGYWNTGYKPSFSGSPNNPWNSLTIETKFYLEGSDKKMEGFFIAPYLKYLNNSLPNYSHSLGMVFDSTIKNWTYPTITQNETFHQICSGAIIGYSKIFKNGFYVSQFIGGGKYLVTIKQANNISLMKGSRYIQTFDFRMGINFGFAF